MNGIVEILVYAAALDLYRRSNRREVRVSGKLSSAMLATVAWDARPSALSES